MGGILVIHPGDSFSTADLYDGLVGGLRTNGATVHEARLDMGLDVTALFAHVATAYGLTPAWARDAFALAAARIIAQAAWICPDAAVIVTGLKLHASVPLTLRRMGIPTVLVCTESPYSAQEIAIAPLYDAICTHERVALTAFGDHPRVYYLPHAYDPARHALGPSDPACQTDVFFCGTAFPERRALLEGVDWSDITHTISGSLWQQPSDEPPTLAAVQEGRIDPFAGIIANADVARWYRSAAISLNHHRTTTEYGSGAHIAPGSAESLGPRAYEIPACGGFMLCDDSRPEIWEVFGDSAATYRAGDSADLTRQIRYWLTHPIERADVARRQHAAVRPHSWHARAAQLLTILHGLPCGPLPPSAEEG